MKIVSAKKSILVLGKEGVWDLPAVVALLLGLTGPPGTVKEASLPGAICSASECSGQKRAMAKSVSETPGAQEMLEFKPRYLNSAEGRLNRD